ncbi:DUF7288 family protein [Haloarcula sediminis]|uniref:DUF7288 family protein n=1 Tax=Haloarcula sediminis TaxID=3111777 RepID=UPI002D78F072|nr:hypothetical protein [Haloarcula sp. CK38]
MVNGDRGQAYTLEGVLAAILVVTATVYGLGAIDTRAWEDETRSETRQLKYQASDVLSIAGESGALRDAVMCYREGRPIDGNQDRTLAEFEQILNLTFDSQAQQYALNFSYWNTTNQRETQLVSDRSQSSNDQPPASAVAASTTVTITDNTSRRIGDECNPIPLTVKQDGEFYISKDVDPSGPLYNVVEVRLVVW